MRGFVKTSLLVAAVCVFSVYLVGAGASASSLSGRDIMNKAFHRYDGDDAYFKIKMTLVDKHGNKRERLLEVYTKDYGELMKSYIRFLEPPDIEGTAFLSWENKRSDDTQYLYLPALGRARRIVSSQKNLRFVNTDFTYEDMQRRRPEKDRHRLIREEEVSGVMCYVVESVPKGGDSQYSRRVEWVDENNFMILKVDFYNRKGEMFKEMRVEKRDIIQGIPTAFVTVMENFKDKHKTVMEVLQAKYNQGLSDEIFSLRNLEED